MKLDRETRMTISVLARNGQSGRAIARMLGVAENTVRYHLRRQAMGAVDGRARQEHKANGYRAMKFGWGALGRDRKADVAVAARLRAALGPDFDIRSFHAALLGDGETPLSALDLAMRAWIAQKRAAGAGGAR